MEPDSQALLDSLANTQLPSLLPSEPAEPVEPREVVIEERGKSPEEVVESREARLPAVEKETPAPAKGEEKLYEVRGIKYTAKELEQAGLLEDLAVTHAKHQHLQERYNELLKTAGEKPAPAEPPRQVLTNAAIAKTYDPFAAETIKELVATNLIETDLPEAYPRSVQTMIGQLRFAFDLIFDMREQLSALVKESSAGREKVQGQIVQNAFNQQLDALVAKDQKLYGGLKDPKVRASFGSFLVDEVGATVGQATGEKAQGFLAKQWVAFNADTVIDAAKNGVQAKKTQADKRFVVGEGAGSRPGLPDTGELSVLDKMIQRSGKISE